MKQFFCLLAIVTCFNLVSSQGIPSMPGVIDLKEPDLKVTPVRHYSNTSVIELKEPSVEENIVKEEVAPVEREEENIIEEEEVGPVERAKEEVLEKEEEHSVEKEGEPSTEVIPIDPEENIIFYIPDFGKEEEEDILIDSDKSDEPEVAGDINDFEGVDLKEYYHPHSVTVNHLEYEVIDKPPLADTSDKEDILIDTDKSDESEVAGDVNDFEEVDLKEYYHPHSVGVNHLEHEVVDYPHLSDSESDKEDILIDSDKSDEPEVAEGTNDLGGAHPSEEESSPVNVNHLEYEVTDKPPLPDTSDTEDIIIDVDKSDEPEVAEGTNDLDDVRLPEEKNSHALTVNHLEYEVTDKPPLPDTSDTEDIIIDVDKSDEPEVAQGTNHLRGARRPEEGSPVNVNHLEYEVTDKPPLGDITDDDDLFDVRDDDGQV